MLKSVRGSNAVYHSGELQLQKDMNIKTTLGPELEDRTDEERRVSSPRATRRMLKLVEKAKPTFIDISSERQWSHFRDLKFHGKIASSSYEPDLLAHAKIYVFADRYLIDSLRDQCLKSLHRDLCNFSINLQDIEEILELLEYTYEQTGRQSSSEIHSLRSVVIHYTACEIRTLIEETRFRSLLDSCGEMGSELVAQLFSQST